MVRRGIHDHSVMVQPGTWVTLLTGHMGDTREAAEGADRVVRVELQSEERSDEDAGLLEPRGAQV